MSKPANTTLRMLYGTAWKKERTTALVTQALQAGFLAVDTAAQPKHYQEHLVGKGVRTFLSGSNLTRGELYLQTKYTSINGQDPNNLPYDPSTSITEQVKASVASSLHNLRHTEDVEDSYIDCLVLHSPLPNIQQTMEAWDAMASFYAATGWDIGLREFCKENSIEYQSFWTLTGNPKFLGIPLVTRAAEEIGVSVEVAIYALVQGLGITPINGTTSHIETDIAKLLKLEEWKAKGHNSETWGKTVRAFELLLQKWSLASY
ncbi:Aldo/keto reductase [Aureobasidium pullulans]|nr:Aldo/keto reductase [Aureobasidium pullulans]